MTLALSFIAGIVVGVFLLILIFTGMEPRR